MSFLLKQVIIVYVAISLRINSLVSLLFYVLETTSTMNILHLKPSCHIIENLNRYYFNYQKNKDNEEIERIKHLKKTLKMDSILNWMMKTDLYNAKILGVF
jgi:hypothetical protein